MKIKGVRSLVRGQRLFCFSHLCSYVNQGCPGQGVGASLKGSLRRLSVALGSRQGICPNPWCLSRCQGHPVGCLGYVPILMISEQRNKVQHEGPSSQRQPLSRTQPVRRGGAGGGGMMGHFAGPSQSAWESSGCSW